MASYRHNLKAAATTLLAVFSLVAARGCGSRAPDGSVVTSSEPTHGVRQYELRIDSIPIGSKVVIDGEDAGRTPITRRFNEPAAVVVEVAAPGHTPAVLRTDAQWWLHSAAATAARRFAKPVIVRNFQAKLDENIALRIVSEPPDSLVTVNGETFGPTPTRLVWDGTTPLVIRITRDGFMPLTTRIDEGWWEQHRSTAELDEAENAFVATVSAGLSLPSTDRWTRVGQSIDHVSLAVQPGTSHQAVPAIIRGPSGQIAVRFLFDTGATYTTLDTQTAQEIGLDFDQATSEITAQTANGVVTRNVILLPELEIGGHAIRNVAIVQCDNCRSDGMVGLLGLNVSREFSTNFSAEGQRMTLTPANSGLGRVLSMKAFLDVSELASTSARIINKCDQTMRNVVVEFIQRDVNGKYSGRVRTTRFNLPAGTSRIVSFDLGYLTESQSYELRIVEGKW